MTHRTILISPDPKLRLVSKDISTDEIHTEETQILIQDMIETMVLDNGIGIAAPQINVLKRIIIVDIGDNQPTAFINPKIRSKSILKSECEEGCLSVPGVFGMVKRHKSVTVEARDQTGKLCLFRAVGLLSIVFQHEIDHLDGIIFIDKVTRYTAHPKL